MLAKFDQRVPRRLFLRTALAIPAATSLATSSAYADEPNEAEPKECRVRIIWTIAGLPKESELTLLVARFDPERENDDLLPEKIDVLSEPIKRSHDSRELLLKPGTYWIGLMLDVKRGDVVERFLSSKFVARQVDVEGDEVVRRGRDEAPIYGGLGGGLGGENDASTIPENGLDASFSYYGTTAASVPIQGRVRLRIIWNLRTKQKGEVALAIARVSEGFNEELIPHKIDVLNETLNTTRGSKEIRVEPGYYWIGLVRDVPSGDVIHRYLSADVVHVEKETLVGLGINQFVHFDFYGEK